MNIQDKNYFSERSSEFEEENKKNNQNEKKENIKEKMKENIKEKMKENIKDKMKENIKDKMKERIKENTKDTTKDRINEKTNTLGPIYNSQKNLGKNRAINIKIKNLPFLSIGFKEENSLEEKSKINLSSLEVEKNKKEKIKIIKQNLKINNNDKEIRKHINRNASNKIDFQKEKNKQSYKVIDLSIPSNPFTQFTISGINKKGKNLDMVNSMINNYRAQLFSKAHSPEVKNEINNEILDIPKKVTQAFGRTTYNFYFKKDAIDCLNANKNINDFGYDGPKKGYNFKSQKRIESSENKMIKNNLI